MSTDQVLQILWLFEYFISAKQFIIDSDFLSYEENCMFFLFVCFLIFFYWVLTFLWQVLVQLWLLLSQAPRSF